MMPESNDPESNEPAVRPLRLVLMGTGPFAVPSFEALRAAGHEIACVVTRPQPPVRSRKGPPPSPVRAWAQSHGMMLIDPDSINAEDAVAQLRQFAADLLVVCDYGQILKPAALEAARLGGINLHGSLLPKYRGAAPVQWAMLSGDEVTGVSVIHMTPRLDGGPVITTRQTKILEDETAGELEARLAELGIEATLQAVTTLSRWDGHSPIGLGQDPDQVTKAPRLEKKDGQIDWTRTAREIDCHVRGMQPWPIAFTHLSFADDKPPLRLAIKSVQVLQQPAEPWEPGQVVPGDQLIVACSDRLVEITSLQPAGKREMSGQEFLRGHQPTPGTRLISL